MCEHLIIENCHLHIIYKRRYEIGKWGILRNKKIIEGLRDLNFKFFFVRKKRNVDKVYFL